MHIKTLKALTKEEFKIVFDSWFDKIRSYLFYRGASAEQASDLAQDVFLRIWEKKVELEPKTIGKLLYKMAGDMFISKYRRSKVEANYLSSLVFDYEMISPQEQIQYKELAANYSKALEALSDKQRTVFLMAKMDGMKYHEIAEQLDLSVKAVEKRMSQALAYLRNVLKPTQ